MSLKLKYARFKIRWRDFKKKRMSAKKPSIDGTQKKALNLLADMLKNKSTKLNCSPQSGSRFIDSEFVWICIASAGDNNNYIINIINESIPDSARSHEVLIPKEYAYDFIDEFDYELERRFRVLESEKQRLVVNDLENLIEIMKK